MLSGCLPCSIEQKGVQKQVPNSHISIPAYTAYYQSTYIVIISKINWKGIPQDQASESKKEVYNS